MVRLNGGKILSLASQEICNSSYMSVRPLSGIMEGLFSSMMLNLLKNPCCDSTGEIVNLDFVFPIICLILLSLLGSDLKFCIISLCKPLASDKMGQ